MSKNDGGSATIKIERVPFYELPPISRDYAGGGWQFVNRRWVSREELLEMFPQSPAIKQSSQ